MVKKRIERTGDGTHEVWGWGDRDMTVKDKKLAQFINREVK
jgi:stearoyl-CoA desaturase (delta-9 desaturase)